MHSDHNKVPKIVYIPLSMATVKAALNCSINCIHYKYMRLYCYPLDCIPGNNEILLFFVQFIVLVVTVRSCLKLFTLLYPWLLYKDVRSHPSSQCNLLCSI